METKRIVEKDAPLKKDDLIVITGGGGFIGGNLALYFKKKGFTNIRAVDKKPLYEWYLHVPGVQNLCLDVSLEDNCGVFAKAPWRFTTWRPTWAAWASLNVFVWNACGPSLSIRTWLR